MFGNSDIIEGSQIESVLKRITDVGVEHLSSLTALTAIDLSLCSEITDECLTCLATLTIIEGSRIVRV